MKLCVILCFVVVLFCVRESDSLKILKKLKNLLHPTESSVTSTALPTVPEYENRPGGEDIDCDCEDQEYSQTNKNPSTSQSWEDQGSSSKSSKTSYDSVKPKKKRPSPGETYQTNQITTETSNYNSYGTDQGNDPSSFDSNIAGSSTTTDMYDQSNNQENFPSQSSFSDGYAGVRSTTQINNYDTQNQLGQDGIYSQNSQTTTTDMYDQGNNQESFPSQSSFSGGYEGGRSTTTTNNYYDSQNQLGQDGIYSQNTQTTTETYGNKEQENLPSVGGVSLADILSATPVNIDIFWGNSDAGQSSTTDSSLSPSSDAQPPVFGSSNTEGSQSTTSKSTYSLSDSSNSPSNNQESSYNQFSSSVPTTTPTLDNSQLNNVNGQPLGSSTTYGSSIQGGDQQKQTYIPRRNQTKHRDDGGVIIFPDDPSLNPTPETERIFGESDPHLKHFKDIHSIIRVPVGADAGRAVIDAATRTCGPGKALDTKRNVCRTLAR